MKKKRKRAKTAPEIIKDKPMLVAKCINRKGKIVDPNFLRAMFIDYMANPLNAVDKRAKARFCLIYDCPPALVNEWTKDKETQAEIRKFVRELFGGGEKVKQLYLKLWEQADAGRVSAIKLALELVGEYTPKLQHLDRPKSLEEMLDKMDKKEEIDITPGATDDGEPISPTRH